MALDCDLHAPTAWMPGLQVCAAISGFIQCLESSPGLWACSVDTVPTVPRPFLAAAVHLAIVYFQSKAFFLHSWFLFAQGIFTWPQAYEYIKLGIHFKNFPINQKENDFIFKIYYCVYVYDMYTCECNHVYARAHVWRSENNWGVGSLFLLPVPGIELRLVTEAFLPTEHLTNARKLF